MAVRTGSVTPPLGMSYLTLFPPMAPDPHHVIATCPLAVQSHPSSFLPLSHPSVPLCLFLGFSPSQYRSLSFLEDMPSTFTYVTAPYLSLIR